MPSVFRMAGVVLHQSVVFYSWVFLALCEITIPLDLTTKRVFASPYLYTRSAFFYLLFLFLRPGVYICGQLEGVLVFFSAPEY